MEVYDLFLYLYIHTYIYILCIFNGTGDFIYPVVKEGSRSELGYPYSLFRTRRQLELQSESTKHMIVIVIGIQWDIAVIYYLSTTAPHVQSTTTPQARAVTF